MEVVRKISAATLSAGHKLKGIEAEKYLGRLYGFAKSVEVITTAYGNADKFNGEFIAERSPNEHGEIIIVMGPTCYLPSVVSGILAAAIVGPNSQGVKFGFDVYAVPDSKSATGYIWKLQPLMEIKPSAGLLEFAKDFAPVGALEEEKKETKIKGK
jgi:hypothetical protein